MTRLIILFYFFFLSPLHILQVGLHPFPPPPVQPMKRSEMGKRVTLPNPETPPSESLVSRVHCVDYSE